MSKVSIVQQILFPQPGDGCVYRFRGKATALHSLSDFRLAARTVAEVTICRLQTALNLIVAGQRLYLVAGEFLLNLGSDTAPPSSTTLPSYDGSLINLYSDNAGDDAIANPYLTTGTGGFYRGWTTAGIQVVDLLITDSSGVAQAVIPFVVLGAESNGGEYTVNVMDFGAAGDAVIGDQSNDTNDAPAFRLALDAAIAAGHRNVYVPCGNYRIGTSSSATSVFRLVDGDDGIHIFGDGDCSVVMPASRQGQALPKPRF